MVAVIGALDEEVELISQSLQDLTHTHAAGLDIALGDIASASGPIGVAAAVAGMGLVNAASAAQYMIDAFAPEAVIFSGIGGNLSPDLHINDVVLGKTLRYLDSDMALIGQAYPGLSEYHSDPALWGSLPMCSAVWGYIIGKALLLPATVLLKVQTGLLMSGPRPGLMWPRWRGLQYAMLQPGMIPLHS